jgi:hypothetical protein
VYKSREAYLALQGANKQTIEDLARLVRVADILERLGRVLATNVKEDFLTTAASQLASYARKGIICAPPCAIATRGS